MDHEPITLQTAQRLGQYVLRDAVDRPSEFGKTHRAVRQPVNNQQRPLPGDAVRHLPRRAMAIEDVPLGGGFQKVQDAFFDSCFRTYWEDEMWAKGNAATSYKKLFHLGDKGPPPNEPTADMSLLS